MGSLPEGRHEKTLEAWRRWYRAKRQRDRDVAIFALWSLCEPEIWHAAAEIAKKLGDAAGRKITVSERQLLHGFTNDDVKYAAFPAVAKAAKGFDPYVGASFQTYAYSFILSELRSSVVTEDALNFARALSVDRSESEEVSAECRDMWRLFELEQDELGRLGYLEPEILAEARKWIDENQQTAAELFGRRRVAYVRFYVGYLAWMNQLPPDARRKSLFADKPKDGLPLQGVAIRADGKEWDLALPIRAEILRQKGLAGRAIARLLSVPESTLRDTQKRAKHLGFSLSRFTPHELEATARGEQGKRQESS